MFKLSYFFHIFLGSKKIVKLIKDAPGRLFHQYVLLSVTQCYVRLFKRTIKASDLRFAAKCRHWLHLEVFYFRF